MSDPIVPAAPLISWKEMREAIARCVAAAAPNARMHNEWRLSFDMTKNVSLLTAKTGDDKDSVHAWMLGIQKAERAVSSLGASGFEWWLTFAIWGFMGYSLSDGSETIENEARTVAATLYASKKVGLTLAAPQALREVGPLEFSSIDVHPFGEGVDVWVAQGNMRTRIEEIFT